MCELYTVYTEQATIHWLRTIDDPSGKLIRCRLRLADFYIKIKYKKGKIKTQEDALSRLNKTGKTNLHDNNDGIPVFHLELISVELELYKNINDVDFKDDQHDEIDELYAPTDDPAPLNTNLKPIRVDVIVQAQLYGPFCAKLRRKRNEEGQVAFEIDDNGIIVHNGDKGINLIAIYSMMVQSLHIKHHSMLAGHLSSRKGYHRIGKQFYWYALASHCYAVVLK